MGTINIIKADLLQTTDFMPSQWEGRTDKNEYVYIRFRHGLLSVSISNKMIINHEKSKNFGDGVMHTPEMIKVLKIYKELKFI